MPSVGLRAEPRGPNRFASPGPRPHPTPNGDSAVRLTRLSILGVDVVRLQRIERPHRVRSVRRSPLLRDPDYCIYTPLIARSAAGFRNRASDSRMMATWAWWPVRMALGILASEDGAVAKLVRSNETDSSGSSLTARAISASSVASENWSPGGTKFNC